MSTFSAAGEALPFQKRSAKIKSLMWLFMKIPSNCSLPSRAVPCPGDGLRAAPEEGSMG